MNKIIGILLLLFVAASCKEEAEPIVKISTNYGDMRIRLYEGTPKHRDNFMKLVKENFYDSLLFHRVINHFMIQGGGPKEMSATGWMPSSNCRNIFTRRGLWLPPVKATR